MFKIEHTLNGQVIIYYFEVIYSNFHPYDNIMARASFFVASLQTVMKATRRQLEKELLIEDISRLEELPSYGLLNRW